MPLSSVEIASKSSELVADGGFFELEDVIIDGHSYRAFKHAPKTTSEVLQNSRNHGELEFLVYEGQRYTYTQLFELIDALAAQLQHTYGVSKGDRVAIAMRNNPQWIISFCAVILTGAIAVPINSWGKSEELQYALRDCQPHVAIYDQARFELIADNHSELCIPAIVVADQSDYRPTQGASLFASVLAAGKAQTFEIPELIGTDPAIILYTSGSTGFPKGVVHRHATIGQCLMSMMFLGLLVAELEGGLRECRGGAKRETPMLTVPLFHGTGLLGGLMLPIMMGQKVVIMHKWSSGPALQLIQDEQVTSLSSVPAILLDLLSHPEYDSFNTESLMRVASAGAATPSGLPELIQAKIPNPSRSSGYGMTETMSVGSTMSGALFDFSPDSAGIISPIMDFRFVDTNGTEVASGQPGEIEMRGICCTPGYWENPEANAEIFNEQRWMKTGDVGRLDDNGYLHITGRIKEIVIRAGENIFPGEIEQAALEMPQVREAVVFGEADPSMGEELVMVLYPNPQAELSDKAVRSYLSGRLASYKVPRVIQIWNQPLPRNASEKLHKLKVKEAYLNAP